MQDNPEKKWGGVRPGAGRPALDGATNLRLINITLGAEHIATAKELGKGNISLGIRRALAFYARTAPAPGDFTPEVKTPE